MESVPHDLSAPSDPTASFILLQYGFTGRILKIVDQYSRKSPALEVDGSLSGKRVVENQERLARLRGKPETITVDNGREICSQEMDDRPFRNGVKSVFIQPGKPIENGFIECLNERLRDDCLNTELFFSQTEARKNLEPRRRDYHECRPHGSLLELPALEYLRQAQNE